MKLKEEKAGVLHGWKEVRVNFCKGQLFIYYPKKNKVILHRSIELINFEIVSNTHTQVCISPLNSKKFILKLESEEQRKMWLESVIAHKKET